MRQETPGEADRSVGDSTRDYLLSNLAEQQARQDELTAMLRYTARNPQRRLHARPAYPASLNDPETWTYGHLTGEIVDLDLEIVIDVGDDGWACLTYRHELLNLTDRPVSRVARDLWFENTRAPLVISPLDEAGRRVVIQRIHDTANLAKFACQISPAVQPGESAVIRFTCEGCQFVSDHYWRQTLARHTRHLTISVRHRKGGRLLGCTAVEEHPDGSENSATDTLSWDHDGSDVIVTVTRDNLLPNQAMTLRWDVTHETA